MKKPDFKIEEECNTVGFSTKMYFTIHVYNTTRKQTEKLRSILLEMREEREEDE